MDDKGRIVVVAAGFALWMHGKCVAAARWSDVVRLRGYLKGSSDAPSTCLAVELRDGSVLELREEAPGYDAFLDRASVTLPRLLPYKSWRPGLTDPGTPGDDVVIFERSTKNP
jgi:hypothetical protein